MPYFTDQNNNPENESAIDSKDPNAYNGLNILHSVRDNPTPENNLAAAKVVQEKHKLDQEDNPNTKTQWAPLILSILARDYKGALTAWNGGPTHAVDAYDAKGNQYWKEYNLRAATGKIYKGNADAKQELTPEEYDQVAKNGGLKSKIDTSVVGTAGYENVGNIAKTESQMVNDVYKKASLNGQQSAGRANTHNEMATLALGLKNPLDAFARLTPKQREEVIRQTSASFQASKTNTQNAETSQSNNASASNTKSATTGTNAGLSGGVGGGINGGGVPPKTSGSVRPSIGGDVGASSGASDTNQATNSQNNQASNSTGNSATNALQIQQQSRSVIEGLLQKNLSDKEYQNFQRYLLLDQSLKEQYAARPKDQIVTPGVTEEIRTDPALSGHQNALLASYQGIKNEALNAAYQHFLATKVHEVGGKSINPDEFNSEFENSKVYKGIQNRYNALMDEARTGKAHEPQKGEFVVTNNLQVKVYRGKDSEGNDIWEKVNAR